MVVEEGLHFSFLVFWVTAFPSSLIKRWNASDTSEAGTFAAIKTTVSVHQPSNKLACCSCRECICTWDASLDSGRVTVVGDHCDLHRRFAILSHVTHCRIPAKKHRPHDTTCTHAAKLGRNTQNAGGTRIQGQKHGLSKVPEWTSKTGAFFLFQSSLSSTFCLHVALLTVVPTKSLWNLCTSRLSALETFAVTLHPISIVRFHDNDNPPSLWTRVAILWSVSRWTGCRACGRRVRLGDWSHGSRSYDGLSRAYRCGQSDQRWGNLLRKKAIVYLLINNSLLGNIRWMHGLPRASRRLRRKFWQTFSESFRSYLSLSRRRRQWR